MIFPLGHEDLRGRRWPVVTIAIIALNLIFFLATHSKIEEESQQIGQVKVHILILAANFPKVQMTPEVKQLAERFQASQPKIWERMKSHNRPVEDAWDARLRMTDEFDADAEMAGLTAEYESLEAKSVFARYAFFPYKPTATSYVTANFLHGGWLHIIFNMWFLWLAGTVLEDAWGRVSYAVIYLLAGFAALWAHALANSGSLAGVIGASGCVAGLMGAFLVRNFKTKIDFVLIYALGFIPRLRRFKAPAWLMLPLWLATQIFWALLAGSSGGGVAYWAHIGGFIFGAAVGLGLKFSGLDKKMDQAVEAEVSWSAHPRVTKATELLEKNSLDEAIAELKLALQEQPGLLEAQEMLVQIYWRKQDMENYRQGLVAQAHLHMQKKDLPGALQCYDDLEHVGGGNLQPGDWVQLCRYFEGQQNWDRAASEYEKFAHAWPADKLAVYSLVSAARLNLKKLERREEAARLYREAAASSVPHMDWNDAIKRGLAEATEPVPTHQ